MAKRKNLRSLLIGVGLLTIVGVAGISAYFTATDSVTNTFKVEEVKVDLTEPKFDQLTEDDKLVTPNETIVKDPTVTNTGNTDEFVFLSVKVPYKNIVTAKLTGERNAAADTELFTWNAGQTKGAINAAKGAKTGAVNNGWVLVKTNILDGVVEYIYAWGTASAMTPLAEGDSTATLFDSVTMCNAVEGQGLENQTVDIDIDVYAIQKSDLNTSGNGTKLPTEVLNIYLNQWNTNPANAGNQR